MKGFRLRKVELKLRIFEGVRTSQTVYYSGLVCLKCVVCPNQIVRKEGNYFFLIRQFRHN